MDTTNIYVLIDPETNKIRYVGKANNIKQRYKAHLNKARKHQIHKKNWIESLKKKGLRPILEIIDVVPINEWIFWETYWISQFRTWGFNLINYTNGGEGSTFGNQTSYKKGHGAKPIVALTREGVFVKEFKNCSDGVYFCGKKCVDNALLKNIKSAGGYLWLYKSEYDIMSGEELNKFILWGKKRDPLEFRKPLKKVEKYDLNNILIKTYESAKEASVENNCSDSMIRLVCTGGQKKFKDHIYKYKIN